MALCRLLQESSGAKALPHRSSRRAGRASTNECHTAGGSCVGGLLPQPSPSLAENGGTSCADGAGCHSGWGQRSSSTSAPDTRNAGESRHPSARAQPKRCVGGRCRRGSEPAPPSRGTLCGTGVRGRAQVAPSVRHTHGVHVFAREPSLVYASSRIDAYGVIQMPRRESWRP